MFPHYLEVAGWLAVAACVLAWASMAAYLTVSIVGQTGAPRAERIRWILGLWLLPAVGVVAYLVSVRRTRNSGV